MVAYAAAPLFGFLIASFVGMLLGAVNALTQDWKPSSKLKNINELVIFGTFSALLIYFDRPQKWLFVPLIVIGLTSIHAMDIESIRARIKTYPRSYLAVFITIFMVCGSFGYGRSQAQGLAQNKAANVHVTVENNLVKTRLLGKISSYYFFLGMDGKISQYPESSVKLIIYEKTF